LSGFADRGEVSDLYLTDYLVHKNENFSDLSSTRFARSKTGARENIHPATLAERVKYMTAPWFYMKSAVESLNQVFELEVENTLQILNEKLVSAAKELEPSESG